MRIRAGQKHADPADPDPDPKPCFKDLSAGLKLIPNNELLLNT